MTRSQPPRRDRGQAEVRLAASAGELAGHFAVRHAVFVDEQRLFAESDRDHWDETALHVVALHGGEVVGAVRLYALDEAGLWQGDRLAVTRRARLLRAGGPLVRFAVRTAGELGGHLMIARIQEANVNLFRHLGWDPVGEPVDYRGIPHQRMTVPLSGAEPVFSDADFAWAYGTPTEIPTPQA